MRRLLCVLTVALMTSFLVACSNSNSSNSEAQAAKNSGRVSSGSPSSPSGDWTSDATYCTTLKQARHDFSSFDFTSLSDAQFSKFRARLQTIQNSAPAQVQDDWQVLGAKLDQIKTLLARGGVSFDDLQKLQNNSIPAGFDLKKFKAIVPKLKKLAGDNSIETARAAIARNAKSTCHISMG